MITLASTKFVAPKFEHSWFSMVLYLSRLDLYKMISKLDCLFEIFVTAVIGIVI